MNYEQKYKEALERASKLRVQNPFDTVGQMVEHIFPELKESEDERIRKEIISALKNANYKGVYDKHLAWLEKQGEQKQTWKPSAAQLIVIKDLIEDENTSKVNKVVLRGMFDEFKQFTNTHKREIDDAYLQGICDAKHEIEKQGEQSQLDYEHADIPQKDFAPIEPKFKVGDWVVYNYHNTASLVSKITLIDKGVISLCDTNGLYFQTEINDLNCNYHLWTIQDANDGDVLVTTSARNCPFIYRKTDHNNNLAYFYAGINGNGNFCEGCIKRTLYHFGSASNVAPATKEQRNLLFEKMRKSGYEWNSEKKELKKIEQKTLNADEVIEWLCVNWYDSYICDPIGKFKKDFGL